MVKLGDVVIAASAVASGTIVDAKSRTLPDTGTHFVRLSLCRHERVLHDSPRSRRRARECSAQALSHPSENRRAAQIWLMRDEFSRATREPGDLWLMSTPFGKRGFFYEQWAFSPLAWRRISVPATECSRISKEFLEEARIDLGEARFRQEYMCEFIQNQRSVFLESDVEPCFKDDIPPLWKDRRK